MTPDTTIAPDAPAGNFFSRLGGVLFSPGETFKEIGRTAPVLIPAIVLALIICAGIILTLNRVGMESVLRKQFDPMVERGWMPQEQAEEMIKQTAAKPTVAYIQSGVQGTLAVLVFVVVMAGIFKLISMVLGADNTFKPILSVTLFAFLAISLVTFLITVVLIYLQNPEDIDINNPIGANLGALLGLFTEKGAIPSFVRAFASFIDIFSIWRLALLAIGYAAISKKLKISTIAIWLSVVYLIFALIFSPLMAMFM
jgi:Yip1 domain